MCRRSGLADINSALSIRILVARENPFLMTMVVVHVKAYPAARRP